MKVRMKVPEMHGITPHVSWTSTPAPSCIPQAQRSCKLLPNNDVITSTVHFIGYYESLGPERFYSVR
jgi:hypothetical protein